MNQVPCALPGGLVAILAVAVAASTAQSAIVTSSPSAPLVSVISQPDFSGPAFNGGQDFSDNAGPPGQTFTAPIGFDLASVTVKGFANTGASFGGDVNTGTWTITISLVTVGNVLTRLTQETADPAAVTDGSAYITLALGTPITLAAGTQYAFDIFSSNGYYGFAKSSADVYAGGDAIQHGSTARTALDVAVITNTQAVDRTFFVAAVPEPGTAGLALAGLGLAVLRRRRR